MAGRDDPKSEIGEETNQDKWTDSPATVSEGGGVGALVRLGCGREGTVTAPIAFVLRPAAMSWSGSPGSVRR